MKLFIINPLNPDFSVEIVMRFPKSIQISILGYLLDEEIVNYFEIKKCSEMLSCAAFESRNRFLSAKSGLKINNRQMAMIGVMSLAI